MGWLVVVLLGGLWASILLPGALRARRGTSPLDSISAFERSMSLIAPLQHERPPGRQVLVLADPGSVTGHSHRARVLARRRSVLRALAGAVVVTGALAPSVGGPFPLLLAASVVVFAGYVVELRRQRHRRLEARAKTRRLPLGAPAAAPPATTARRRGA